MKGFVDFMREQGVVGLAIGFIIGGAVSKLVASFVSDVINPLVGLIFSVDSLAEMSAGVVTYGAFLTALIDFAIIAAVVYFMFKGLGLEKLDKKKG